MVSQHLFLFSRVFVLVSFSCQKPYYYILQVFLLLTAFISQEFIQVAGTKWQIYLCQVLTHDINFFFHASIYLYLSYKGLNQFHDKSG